MGSKISELTALTTPVAADLLVIVDTTASPDTTKKITITSLSTILAPLASPSFTGTPIFNISGRVEILTTGANTGLLLRSTQDGTNGPRIIAEHITASPAVSDIPFDITINTGGTQYAYEAIRLVNVTGGSEESKKEWHLRVGNVPNEVMNLSGAGVLSVDLGGSGTPAQVDLFDSYDDALVLRQGIQQNNRELLADMGVLNRKNTGSGYMLNLQPMVRLLAGGIYQTRQQLDDLKDELNNRLALVEKKLALLN